MIFPSTDISTVYKRRRKKFRTTSQGTGETVGAQDLDDGADPKCLSFETLR